VSVSSTEEEQRKANRIASNAAKGLGRRSLAKALSGPSDAVEARGTR
jgi:hypothetical protein